MPKCLSQRQLLANRRNAQKSTGPKTPEGKRRSARNAIRHGLYAKDFLLATREQLRAEGRFEEFARNLYETLGPRDASEAALVTRIVNAAWQMRRAIRFEVESTPAQCALPRDKDLVLILRHENRASREFHQALTALRRRRKRDADLGAPPGPFGCRVHLDALSDRRGSHGEVHQDAPYVNRSLTVGARNRARGC